MSYTVLPINERREIEVKLISVTGSPNHPDETRFVFKDNHNNVYEWWTRTALYYSEGQKLLIKATVKKLVKDNLTGRDVFHIQRLIVVKEYE